MNTVREEIERLLGGTGARPVEFEDEFTRSHRKVLAEEQARAAKRDENKQRARAVFDAMVERLGGTK